MNNYSIKYSTVPNAHVTREEKHILCTARTVIVVTFS